eukprot:229037-Rhodomonas_salina.2
MSTLLTTMVHAAHYSCPASCTAQTRRCVDATVNALAVQTLRHVNSVLTMLSHATQISNPTA